MFYNQLHLMNSQVFFHFQNGPKSHVYWVVPEQTWGLLQTSHTYLICLLLGFKSSNTPGATFSRL